MNSWMNTNELLDNLDVMQRPRARSGLGQFGRNFPALRSSSRGGARMRYPILGGVLGGPGNGGYDAFGIPGVDEWELAGGQYAPNWNNLYANDVEDALFGDAIDTMRVSPRRRQRRHRRQNPDFVSDFTAPIRRAGGTRYGTGALTPGMALGDAFGADPYGMGGLDMINSGIGGFGGGLDSYGSGMGGGLGRTQKNRILNDLVMDRSRDRFQNALISKLTANRRVNLNRPALLQALVNGERVPTSTLLQLLCEDIALDHITDEGVQMILNDHATNRFADNTMLNLMGEPEIMGGQGVWRQNDRTDRIQDRIQNDRTDRMLARLVNRVTAPGTAQTIAQTGLIEDHLNVAGGLIGGV